jgi:hypothetical protein
MPAGRVGEVGASGGMKECVPSETGEMTGQGKPTRPNNQSIAISNPRSVCTTTRLATRYPQLHAATAIGPSRLGRILITAIACWFERHFLSTQIDIYETGCCCWPRYDSVTRDELVAKFHFYVQCCGVVRSATFRSLWQFVRLVVQTRQSQTAHKCSQRFDVESGMAGPP